MYNTFMDQNLFSTKQILATANSNKTQEILSYKKLDGKMMAHTHTPKQQGTWIDLPILIWYTAN